MCMCVHVCTRVHVYWYNAICHDTPRYSTPHPPIISPEVASKSRSSSAPGSNEGAILKQIVLKGVANQLSQATVS